MEPNLNYLREAYFQDIIVPFVGAGLSIPFNI